MKKAPNPKQPSTSGEQGSAAKTVIASVAGVAVLLAAGAAYKEINSHDTHREQTRSLQGATTMLKGDILLGSGTHLREWALTDNGNDGGDPSNVKYTVPKNKTLVLVNPVETTDYSGDVWAGTLLPGSKAISSFGQRAEHTVWVNLTGLAGQDKVEVVASNPKSSMTDIHITDSGVVMDQNTHEAYTNAATSTELALSELKQMQVLGLLNKRVIPPAS